MQIAAAKPRVVISGEAVRSSSTSLHATFEALEFAKHLGAARNVKAFVDGDDLH
jgi:hypothetical protein